GRNPMGLAGGRVAWWGGNARLGGRHLNEVEADEFDRAFLALAPTVAVVNNVEADHLECYGGSTRALEQAFVEFASRARRVIAGADDAGALRGAAAASDSGEARGVTVVDDYAHHPTEVLATLAAARQAFPRRRVVAVFQPHLFSRTALHGEALGRALATADVVVVAPIYAASEQPVQGVTADLVARGAARAGATTVAVRDRGALVGRVAGGGRPGGVVCRR